MATAKKTASKAKTTAKKTAAKSTSKKKVAAKKAVKKTIAKKAAPKAVVKKEKKDVIKKHQSHSKDTGSPKVQIALLTEKIDQLSGHLQEHPKDNHSRRGLLTMVGKRRKILRYMESKDKEGYGKFIKKMGLRK
jgi:small subunit ribosomal protein S15